MKIGIVGASGTLGRVFIRKLAAVKPKSEIFVLLRREDPEIERVANAFRTPGGVLDRTAIRSISEQSGVVVNLAAMNPNGQPKDLEQLDEFLLANSLGPSLVADECARANVPLVHLSSVAVYETHAYVAGQQLDESSVMPSLDDASVEYFDWLMKCLREDLDVTRSQDAAALSAQFLRRVHERPYPAATSVYGLTKLAGERAVVETPSIRTCCMRLSDVFGPGHEQRGVISDHLKAASTADTVAIDLGFRKTAYFISIDDALYLIWEFADRIQRSKLPAIINTVGHCMDEAKLVAAFERLNYGSDRDVGFRVAATPEPKFDRQYGTDLLKQTLPDFNLGDFGRDLERTWVAALRANS